MADESVIYEAENIKITNLRAVFGEKTYPISNITSVEKREVPRKAGAAGLFVIVGILFMIAGFTGGGDSNFVTIGIGFGFVALGVLANNQIKQNYAVALVTAGGEVSALELTDEAKVKAIVEALNTAIVQKG